MKGYLLIVSAMFLTFFVQAQNNFSIGVQGGISGLRATTIPTQQDLGGFQAHRSVDANVQAFFRYYFSPTWALRSSVGIMGLSTEEEYLNSSYGRKNRGIHPAVGLSLDRFFELGTGTYGIIASFGISSVFLNDKAGWSRLIQSEEGVRIGSHVFADATGNRTTILAHDVSYNTRNTSLLWHLRPELGVYRKINNHRLSLSLIAGLALGQPLYVHDFRSISLLGDFYSAKHQFSGSFLGLHVGYEFLF